MFERERLVVVGCLDTLHGLKVCGMVMFQFILKLLDEVEVRAIFRVVKFSCNNFFMALSTSALSCRDRTRTFSKLLTQT